MDTHQRIAGLLLAVSGGLAMLSLVAMALMMLTMTPFQHMAFPDWGLVVVMGILWLLSLAWSFASVWAGVSLHRGRRSRLLVPVAVLSLLSFPLGTAAGVYALWSIWRNGAPRFVPEWQRLAAEQRAG